MRSVRDVSEVRETRHESALEEGFDGLFTVFQGHGWGVLLRDASVRRASEFVEDAYAERRRRRRGLRRRGEEETKKEDSLQDLHDDFYAGSLYTRKYTEKIPRKINKSSYERKEKNEYLNIDV